MRRWWPIPSISLKEPVLPSHSSPLSCTLGAGTSPWCVEAGKSSAVPVIATSSPSRPESPLRRLASVPCIRLPCSNLSYGASRSEKRILPRSAFAIRRHERRGAGDPLYGAGRLPSEHRSQGTMRGTTSRCTGPEKNRWSHFPSRHVARGSPPRSCRLPQAHRTSKGDRKPDRWTLIYLFW